MDVIRFVARNTSRWQLGVFDVFRFVTVVTGGFGVSPGQLVFRVRIVIEPYLLPAVG